jgi:alkaline phosphatase
MSPLHPAATVALALACATAFAACPSREPTPNAARYEDASVRESGGPPPKIILLIGDGMGEGQLAAASYYKAGALESLSLYDLPVHGRISTASPSGITDSAASATAMATGALTWNGTVGLDLDDRPVQNLVELSKEYGLATGIVTTTRISHATPASFTAHVQSRGQYEDIAAHMAALRPDIMLGGGLLDFENRGDSRNLVAELVAGDFHIVRTATELADANESTSGRMLGLFADYHLPYRVDRTEADDVPFLKDMSLAALKRLDRDPQGFFLMIEGGRIDHAGHENNVERAIGETLSFDDTVAAVVEWAGERDDVTILVTADHETGGLKVLEPSPQGALPRVSWRWGSHTNASIFLFGQGPGTDVFDGQVRDHRWVHSALSGLIRNQSNQPPRRIIPDGRLTDLLGPTVTQTADTNAAGGARLSRLSLDSDERGIGIGIEGLFPWNAGATLLLIDVDYGLATGVRNLRSLRDSVGSADSLLSAVDLPAPPDYEFGIDLAFLTQGGLEPKFEQLLDSAGLRGLRSPYGTSTELGQLRSAANFSDHSRIYTAGAEELEVITGQGLEVFIRWQELYDGASAPPVGTRIAVWALQLGDDASTSNQSLPPWSDAEGLVAPTPLILSP